MTNHKCQAKQEKQRVSNIWLNEKTLSSLGQIKKHNINKKEISKYFFTQFS